MTTVTETLVLPDGSTPKGVKVEVRLAGEDGKPFPAGYKSGATVVGRQVTETDDQGVWSVDLVGNGDIDPSGTVYRVVLSGRQEVDREPRYIEVPASGGAYRVEELLTGAPSTVVPVPVAVERDRALAAEAALSGRVDDLEVAPPAHAGSHGDGGSDELSLDASQITSGTLDDARIPAGIARDSEVSSAVASAVAALVDSAPEALDTLNELAAALGDDPNFATTVTNALAGKVAASTLTTDGDLLTRAAGVPSRTTRAALAADPAFSSAYVAKADDHIWIPAKTFQTSTGSPTLDGSAGIGSEAGYLLDASSVESVGVMWRFPSYWGAFEADLVWLNNGAGAGDVRWRVQLRELTYGNATPTTIVDQLRTETAAAQNVPLERVAFIAPTITAGKLYILSVIRQATDVADTLANDASFMGLQLRRTA